MKDSKRFTITKTERLPNAEALVTGEINLPFLAELRPEALKHLGKHVEIPGFRPGHIPEEVLIKNLGEMRVVEETAELALAQEFNNIVKDAGLTSIGRPEVSITKLAPGIPLEFRLKVYLEPEFKLPDYKKIAKGIKKSDLQVSDEGAIKAVEKRRLKILEELVKETKMELPKILIDAELEKMLAQFRGDIEQAGIKWDEYIKQAKKTEAEIKTDWRDKAEERVKAELIIFKIAEAESIEPKKEDVEHEATHLLQHYPDADPIRARLYIYNSLRNQKVIEFLSEC